MVDFDFSLQSRVEVILNAIINDLVYGEHPKSRVEQILLYILGEENELPKPHSRVEELLIDLALELESTDISPKSRVEQILLVLLNQPYEFPITHSRVEELLVQLQKHISEVTGPLPLTINTDGEPLIDYRIYGNTVQTGTPTPENPIMPSGCGVRTENLFDYADLEGGFIDINTGENTPNENQKRTHNYITVQANTTYTLSNYEDKCRVHQYSNNSYLGSVLTDTSQYSFTTNSNCTKIRISGNKDNFLETTMLNLGPTPLPYEPYGYKLPILSNSTVTNIYLGEVQSTRRVKKLVLTGEEIINGMVDANDGAKAVSYTYSELGMTDIINNERAMDAIPYPIYLSSHFKEKTSGYSSWFNINAGEIGANNWVPYSINRYLIFGTSEQTQANFKAYLAAQYAAGTPVTIWYVLAEPETGIANEPLMKIGDYTDTISMEQAGVSIPTIKGTTVIDYDGTPKPSQMYVKYNES